jgi:hypothetical protein
VCPSLSDSVGEAGVGVKKVVTWVLVAFLIFYVVSQPAQAAQMARRLGSGVMSIANGFGSFISGLT